jgi:gliding motility-associated-like protein
MLKPLRYSFSFIALLMVPLAYSQVNVSTSLTVEEIVNQILLGDGVDAFNITYNGEPANQVNVQVGTFTTNSSPFPISSGVVMATANANTVVGGGGDPGGNLQNDPDLVSISGGFNMNNCAIIEFDFTVNSDSLVFDYIFASQEYPGFTCTQFNDVFGFFLSGPGITGPFTNNAANIALIPNSSVPVGVNTVNGGVPTGSGNAATCFAANPNWVSDSQYFIPNNPPLQNSISIQGHTVTLRARAQIQCGEVYHIKLAIGNAVDQALQSAVFLKEGSFSATGEVFVNVAPALPNVNVEGTQYEGVIVAGCFSTQVELIRPNNAPTGEIQVSYGGSAQLGIDYILGPNDTLFFFPEGLDTLTYNIQTLVNPNNSDTLFLEIYVIYEICGGQDTAKAVIPIIPPYALGINTPTVTVVCPADSVIVLAQGLNGLEPYFYDWGEYGIGPGVFVPVPPTQAYYPVSMSDPCNFEIITDSVLVINNIPPPLSVGIPQPAVPTCPGDPVNLQAQVVNGNPGYTYIWSPPAPNQPNITVNFQTTQTVNLQVIDICGTTVNSSVEVIYPVYQPIIASFDSVFISCPGDGVNLTANASEGAGLYSYEWFAISGGNTTLFSEQQSVFFSPPFGNITYQLVVTDQCGEQGQATQTYSFFFFPVDSVDVTGRPNCDGTEIEWKVNSVSGGEPPFQYFWSGPGDIVSADTLTGRAVFRNPENEDYTLFVRDRCGFFFSPVNTFSFEPDIVFLGKMPNVITPNRDGKNDILIIEGIDRFPGSLLEVYDRWGRRVFESNNYRAGTLDYRGSDAFGSEDLNDGTYFYVLKVDGGECTKTGWIQVLGSSGTSRR